VKVSPSAAAIDAARIIAAMPGDPRATPRAHRHAALRCGASSPWRQRGATRRAGGNHADGGSAAEDALHDSRSGKVHAVAQHRADGWKGMDRIEAGRTRAVAAPHRGGIGRPRLRASGMAARAASSAAPAVTRRCRDASPGQRTCRGWPTIGYWLCPWADRPKSAVTGNAG